MAPKKKKLTKKELNRIEAERAEQIHLEQEKQRVRSLAQDRLLVEEARLVATEKAKQDVVEQGIREIQLEQTCAYINELTQVWLRMKLNIRRNERWERYLKCDGLPDCMSLSEMSTYLYLWKEVEVNKSMTNALKKTEEVVTILDRLEEMLEDPLDIPHESLSNSYEMRNCIRSQQRSHLDDTTFLMLRRMEQDLELIGLNEIRYKTQSKHLTLCLWGLIPLPVSGDQQGGDKRPRVKCEFPDLGVFIHLPASLTDVHLTVRALWLQYDHLTDLSRSCHEKPIALEKAKDLNDATLNEWKVRCEIQNRQNLRAVSKPKTPLSGSSTSSSTAWRTSTTSAQPIVRSSNTPNSPTNIEPLDSALLLAVKSPAEEFQELEDRRHADLKKKMMYSVGPHELNLRKYITLGGVLHLDLLQQPPQPIVQEELTLSVMEKNPKLRAVDFHALYVPPPPPEPGQRRLPEEIEAELKKQEEELDKLAFVTIALPETVLWFEPPVIAGWNDEKRFWSKKYFHDLKFNEEKQVLTFRTGWFGPMSLAAYRYANLPYQTWELKPDYKNNSVVLSITATVIIVEFIIKGNKICLSQLQNGATDALQNIVGIFYAPYKLFKLMSRGGVDLFPPFDAMCYVEGDASKHHEAEDHLYHTMAILSTTHNFSWSRWNLLAGRRNMVLQMREFKDRKKLTNYNILHVTPLKACFVDCTEVSQAFTEQGVQGMKFYPDLLSLVQDHSNPKLQKRIQEADPILMECVYKLLSRTRVLSFS